MEELKGMSSVELVEKAIANNGPTDHVHDTAWRWSVPYKDDVEWIWLVVFTR
jgi:hypothetical protein